MGGIMKTVVRLGVIGGLGLGAAVLIAGPERVGAVAHQVRGKMVSAIDRNIDDPIAMRQQLRSLEAKYPERIAEARSMKAELVEQIKQVKRDKKVSQRVVALAEDDLDTMRDLIARAEEAEAGFSGAGRQVVKVAFNSSRLTLSQAYDRANRIADTAASYAARVAECDRELAHLERDLGQTQSLLNKLETEYRDFQTQLADLDRQIDTVARKERMADMMAERQKRIDELSRYTVASLDQFKANLAKQMAELDTRIEALVGDEQRLSYEDRAKFEIDSSASDNVRFDWRTETEDVTTETVIEEGDCEDGKKDKESRSPSVAWR